MLEIRRLGKNFQGTVTLDRHGSIGGNGMSDIDESDVERTRRRYEASLSMLDSVEESLQPVVEQSAALGELDLVSRFRAHARQWARALVGGEGGPDEGQREAFEMLFGTSYAQRAGAPYGTGPSPEGATEHLTDYLGWVAALEEQMAGSVGASNVLSGLTAGLCDTLAAIGERLVDAGDDEEEGRAILEDLTEALDELLREKGVEREPPETLS